MKCDECDRDASVSQSIENSRRGSATPAVGAATAPGRSAIKPFDTVLDQPGCPYRHGYKVAAARAQIGPESHLGVPGKEGFISQRPGPALLTTSRSNSPVFDNDVLPGMQPATRLAEKIPNAGRTFPQGRALPHLPPVFLSLAIQPGRPTRALLFKTIKSPACRKVRQIDEMGVLNTNSPRDPRPRASIDRAREQVHARSNGPVDRNRRTIRASFLSPVICSSAPGRLI